MFPTSFEFLTSIPLTQLLYLYVELQFLVEYKIVSLI